MQSELVHEREAFVPTTEQEPRTKQVESYKRRAAEVRELFETHNISRGELGATVGKMIVKELAFLHVLSDLEPHVVQREIDKIHEFYGEVFHGAGVYEKLKSGFLGEFAVAYAISEQLGYPVHLPTIEEDMKGKIDLIVDLEDGSPPLAIQVKSLHMDAPPENIIFNPTDTELAVLPESIANNEEAHTMAAHADTMVEYCSENGLRPLYIIIPSAGGEHSMYNQKSGLPERLTQEGKDTVLADTIWKELQQKGFVSWD
ncbi:hypothetical protein CO179_04610 [candidate division WWE3 bacterium CG_4_9_14_3_um_filter_39_7]|uniref:Uncharacterized protein n=1 Tax=candidate division WWE3 bacterium CG_4_9_14_3_um_filter_39_7 TaxID=1975080 RepID=A0A2M7X177_UNCKA|nr:MAG: hypothetical protein CO179_04610 [candidate division WWE3 bacterium CG_4_9_14_3_um_filter_39_7]